MKALRYVGYGAFFFFCLLLSIYWTFPWHHAKGRVLELASKASGMEIQAASLEPNFVTGMTAKGVTIKKMNVGSRGASSSEEPIAIERLDLRAHLLAFLTGKVGLTVRAPIAKGQVDFDVITSKDEIEADGTITKIELALVPGLKEATGLPLSGEISLDLDLQLSKKEPKDTRGQLKLTATNLELLKGGKIGLYPIPELAIGSGEITVPIEEGRAKLDKQRIAGDNVELVLDGNIIFNKALNQSVLDLTVSFKPTDAFLKKEPLLGALLNNIRHAQSPDGFYTFEATGAVSRPKFVAKRKA